MAQFNKTCPKCGAVGHSGFYCKKIPKKTLSNSTHKIKSNVVKYKSKKIKQTRGQLVRKLDAVFSRYIRQKDAIDGDARCVTCGAVAPWKEMQNGHFYSRGRYATRWDEDNCHVQDYRCNVALKGNYINYTMYMIDRYGRDFVDNLEIKSKSTIKLSRYDLEELINKYSN